MYWSNIGLLEKACSNVNIEYDTAGYLRYVYLNISQSSLYDIKLVVFLNNRNYRFFYKKN